MFRATIIPLEVVGEDDICDVSVYLKNMLLYFDILSIHLMYRNNVMLSHCWNPYVTVNYESI